MEAAVVADSGGVIRRLYVLAGNRAGQDAGRQRRARRIATPQPAVLPAAPLAGGAPAVTPLPYRAPDLLLLLAMWGAMLSATTLPAATPVILLFAHINRLAHAVRFPNIGTFFF